MKLDDARDELNAARFFSGLLRQEQESAQPQHAEAFRYFFQAFLNAMYMVQERVKNQIGPVLEPQARSKQQEPEDYFNELRTAWVTTLSLGEQSIWRSMREMRRTEVHQQRIGMVQAEEEVPTRPVGDTTFSSERNWAFAAHYIDVYQAQGPAYYVRNQAQRVPYSRLVQVTVKVHRFDAYEQREVVATCETTIPLLQRLIDYFEQLCP